MVTATSQVRRLTGSPDSGAPGVGTPDSGTLAAGTLVAGAPGGGADDSPGVGVVVGVVIGAYSPYLGLGRLSVM